MHQVTALDEEGCAVTTALERLPFAKLFAVVEPAIEFCFNSLLIMSKMIHDTTKMGTIMMRMIDEDSGDNFRNEVISLRCSYLGSKLSAQMDNCIHWIHGALLCCSCDSYYCNDWNFLIQLFF